MHSERMVRLYARTGRNRLLITFHAAVTQPLIERMAEVIKVQWGAGKPETRRLMAVFVELAQNILHHSAERADGPERAGGVGLIEISEEEGRITVQTGNVIRREDAPHLAEQIRLWSECGGAERKQRAQERRRGPRRGTHAGLGLAEVAIKTDGGLSVAFEAVGDERDFAVITAVIRTGASDE